MKSTFLILMGLVFVSMSAQAFQINGGRLNADKTNLRIDVTYTGGCEKHQFQLLMDACVNSSPVQCRMTLVDENENDACEALINETVEINLAKAGIQGSFYSSALLKINGPGQNNSLRIQLPAHVPLAPLNDIACTSDSKLQMNIYPTKGILELITAEGKKSSVKIFDTAVQMIEPGILPSILQSEFALDDQRSAIIEFPQGSKLGTGYLTQWSGGPVTTFACELK